MWEIILRKEFKRINMLQTTKLSNRQNYNMLLKIQKITYLHTNLCATGQHRVFQFQKCFCCTNKRYIYQD